MIENLLKEQAMITMQSLTIGSCLFFTALVTAESQVIEVQASSSASVNATGCCSISYMGSINPPTISMQSCQTDYNMNCVLGRRAAVWQFDLSGLPEDATLLSAHFKGMRTASNMTGSGFISMAFDTGPLSSSVCMQLWNGGSWESASSWPSGAEFSLLVTSGLMPQFDEIATVSILSYVETTYPVVVINSGSARPVLELTLEMSDATPCVGDLNDDEVVDGADISLVLGYWGHLDTAYDVDGDGRVDGADLAMVLGAWGACPE